MGFIIMLPSEVEIALEGDLPVLSAENLLERTR